MIFDCVFYEFIWFLKIFLQSINVLTLIRMSWEEKFLKIIRMSWTAIRVTRVCSRNELFSHGQNISSQTKKICPGQIRFCLGQNIFCRQMARALVLIFFTRRIYEH